jgi:hypothetical protein
MTRPRRAMAFFLLLTGLQFSLAGQSDACVPSGETQPSTITVAPSSHDGHQGSQHDRGEHLRQHCLTSVTCTQLPSPDAAEDPFSTFPVSGHERLATLTAPRSQSAEPSTPPPRA